MDSKNAPDGPLKSTGSFHGFVRLCEAEGLLSRPPGLAPNDVCDGLNCQVTLQRFFTARSEQPEAALVQFKKAVDIRNSINHVATYDTMHVDEYEATRKMYPHWTGRRDKHGHPICFFDIAHLDKTTMEEYKKSRDMSADQSMLNSTQRAIAIHESLTRFTLPLCSAMKDRANPDTPISSAIYLVDVSSFGLKQAYKLRIYAQDISTLLATSFPEVVKTVYVLNAPSYFGKIWNFLKKWIDPNTASKLVIVPTAEVLSTLQSEIDIENIPKQFGGQFVFKHGIAIDLDKDLCQQLGWVTLKPGTLPPGPMKWIVDDSGRRTAVAVGTLDRKARLEPIAVIGFRRDSIQKVDGQQS